MTSDHAPAPGPADYARACIEGLVRSRRIPPAPLHPLYERRAACFVSLKKAGELRGCIGTLDPVEPDLGREIARNAGAAALKDPRFAPVGEDELATIVCSVDILSPSEECTFSDLDPIRFGVIVQCGLRRGVLLPDLKGIDDARMQVDVARQKANIFPSEPLELARFSVIRCVEGQTADHIIIVQSERDSSALRTCDEVDG